MQLIIKNLFLSLVIGVVHGDVESDVNTALGVMDPICNTLGFLGPKGMAVGAICGVITDITRKYLPKSCDELQENIESDRFKLDINKFSQFSAEEFTYSIIWYNNITFSLINKCVKEVSLFHATQLMDLRTLPSTDMREMNIYQEKSYICKTDSTISLQYVYKDEAKYGTVTVDIVMKADNLPECSQTVTAANMQVQYIMIGGACVILVLGIFFMFCMQRGGRKKRRGDTEEYEDDNEESYDDDDYEEDSYYDDDRY